jgi:hypothetical protein
MSNVNPQSNNLKYVPPKDSGQKENDEGKKPVIPLEEDDEFEDFPVEGTPAHSSLRLVVSAGV